MKAQASRAPARFDVDPNEPVYVIGVVSHLIHLPVWTLRVLDREGLVKARRRDGRWRLYSLNDLRRLARIRALLKDAGVNVKGVQVILKMEMREYV